jgi:hypothetical protein
VRSGADSLCIGVLRLPLRFRQGASQPSSSKPTPSASQKHLHAIANSHKIAAHAQPFDVYPISIAQAGKKGAEARRLRRRIPGPIRCGAPVSVTAHTGQSDGAKRRRAYA